MNAKFLYTSRLLFIASTPEILQAELSGNNNLEEYLNAAIPSDWPAGEYDQDAMRFFLSQLEAGGEEAAGWFGWHVIALPTEHTPATLVAGGGYFGPPDKNGQLEIGYSVSKQWRKKGIATEIVTVLVNHALTHSGVKEIVAHTDPRNEASKRALIKNRFIETTSEGPEKLCFRLIR